MHPYEMQRLIKQRCKDRVINVGQRASLYKTVHRLSRDGLIAALEIVRDAQRPERTVYMVTEAGRATAREWLRDMLAVPPTEFPEFPAAISMLPLLDVDDAVLRLMERRTRLIESLARQEAELASLPALLPRLFLLEEEYCRAIAVAELNWVDAILDDLHAGRLNWSPEWLIDITAKLSPPHVEGFLPGKGPARNQ